MKISAINSNTGLITNQNYKNVSTQRHLSFGGGKSVIALAKEVVDTRRALNQAEATQSSLENILRHAQKNFSTVDKTFANFVEEHLALVVQKRAELMRAMREYLSAANGNTTTLEKLTSTT